MSASRDKNQKFTFVYSNLYQIYKKEKEADQATQTPPTSGVVLKTETLSSSNPIVQVRDYQAPELKHPAPAQSNPYSNPLPHLSSIPLANQQAQPQANPRPESKQNQPAAKITSITPPQFQAQFQAQFQGRRVKLPDFLESQVPARQAASLEDLKNNLNSLQQLQKRLRFMLQEIEELLK